MMRRVFLFAAVAACAFAVGCGHPQPVVYAAPPPPPPPPAVFSEVARQAYHAGTEAARRDLAAGLRPNVRRHPYFRNPPVAPELMGDYQHGFREGYRTMYRAATALPPPPPGE